MLEDTNDNLQHSENSSDKITLPVIEERPTVDKKEIETGKVLITKKVHSETQVIDVPVVEEEVDIQRIPINQYVEIPPPAIRYEGEKTIIPILKEVLVVEKKLVLVEEIHIKRKQVHSLHQQQESVKKEEIIVNRVNTDDPTSIQ